MRINTTTKGFCLRLSFIIFYSFILKTCLATTYYFSKSLGDDSRSRIQAQNPSTPWKSIDKLNSIFSSLQPGDVILFNRNETFYGSILVSKSGTASNRIKIGAYGTGSKPIITGLSPVSDWTDIGSGIYEQTLSFTPASSINMVTFQDTLQPIGRWPKVTDPQAGYLPFQSHYGTYSISSNAISNAPSFVGGEIVFRPFGWILDRATITDQSSTDISYTSNNGTYEPLDGHGFFFQNHVNALTQLGDWMYDNNANALRMYFGTRNPSNYKVKVATVENLVNIHRYNYLTFDGLSFIGPNSNAFDIDFANNIIITNCDIALSGSDGIFILNNNTNNVTVSNCTISNSNNNAITGNSSANMIIQNNMIRNTGLIRGMGHAGDGQYIGINHVGTNSLVEFNDIRNTGYNGIEFDGNNTIISHNFIDSFCVIKSDGGGIYNSVERNKTGRKVIGNIILDGIGDRFGRSQEEIDDPLAGNVHGIYMDGGASNVTIDSNTVANCGNSGLELSSPLNLVVRNNTFYNNKVTQIYYWESYGPISNLTLKNNILFSKVSEQLLSIINSDQDSEGNWGTIDNNYYCRPVSEPDGVDTSGYSHSPENIDFPDGGIIQAANNRFYSLDKWKELTGQDRNSKKTPFVIPDITKQRFVYNASKNNKTITLDGIYTDIKLNIYTRSITLKPYTSAILLNNTGILAPSLVAKSSLLDINQNAVINKAKISVYPNPFSNGTNIQVSAPETGEASITLYDFQGRTVKQIFNGRVEKDQIKNVHLTSEGLSTGVYILSLATKNKIITQKVSVIN